MDSTPDSPDAGLKRKRSPSASAMLPAPAAKATKIGASQLSINYLARVSNEDLPLITKDDSLPYLLYLLSSYSSILDRHESLASNLGARPLGPILIKRFERCFDTPPKIVASHHKGTATAPDDTSPHTITWLEVIEFARAHPGQFTLSTFSEGKRVCQFYYPTKQLRVQISEEDFLFINSGRCQELIPPLPIWEDEEKEVGTCDVLEAKLKELTNVADMVAARTRQLSHRLRSRRAAILERRAEGGSGTPAKASAPQMTTAPGSGFTAVNSGADGVEPALGSNAAIRNELLRHFESLPHNQNAPVGRASGKHQSIVGSSEPAQHHPRNSDNAENGGIGSNASSLSPIPTDMLSYYTTENPPASSRQPGNANHQSSSSTGGQAYNSSHAPLKHNFSRPLPPALESSQPFRPLCQAHMDSLPRGHRVIPPCDRCRRLRMDCVKNLTSCQGCTKKHARCHWRDVSREEVGSLDHIMDPYSSYSPTNGESSGHANGYVNGAIDLGYDDSDDEDSDPLKDLNTIAEKEDAAEREKEDEARELEEVQTMQDVEGLLLAKELARQGCEESLRTGAPLPQNEISLDNHVQDEVGANGGDDVVMDDTVQTETRPLPSKIDNEVDDEERHEAAMAAMAAKDAIAFEMPASHHAGFRAVNDSFGAANVGRTSAL